LIEPRRGAGWSSIQPALIRSVCASQHITFTLADVKARLDPSVFLRIHPFLHRQSHPDRDMGVAFRISTGELYEGYRGVTFVNWNQIVQKGADNPDDLGRLIAHEEVHQYGIQYSTTEWDVWDTASCVYNPH
jgi:hypothetical protein